MIKEGEYQMMMKGIVAYPNGDMKLEEVPIPKLGDNPFKPQIG